MTNHPTQVIFDRWDTYVVVTDEGPVFVSFDEGATEKDLGGSLPRCARVIIPIHHPNRAGGPVHPENERLWTMEDQLCASLSEAGVTCRLVGRLTYGGRRELVFQLADRDAFRPPLAFWMARNPDYEMDFAEHDGWEFFDTFIRPTPEQRLAMADGRVIEGLIEAGSDPEKPHVLEFVFCGDAGGLQHVADALAARGYRPAVPLEFASGQIVMFKEMTLDASAILGESIAHRRLAAECGVAYDGWGAAVVE